MKGIIKMTKILKQVQEKQYEILKEVDRICRKNNIKYHLYAGTLLGAIRHNGFIPWDDDIDIAMKREEYEKFLKVVITDLDNRFFIQHFSTDKNSIIPFIKIRMNNTTFLEKESKNIKMHQGIFIDIFPLDKVINGKSSFKYKINILRIKILFKIMINAHGSIVYNKKIGILNIFKIPIKIFKIFPARLFNRKINSLSQKYSDANSIYYSNLSNSVDKTQLKRFMMNEDELEKFLNWRFIYDEFPITELYDQVLTRCYGDYLSYPPKEMQVPHHGTIISFDNLHFYDGYEGDI